MKIKIYPTLNKEYVVGYVRVVLDDGKVYSVESRDEIFLQSDALGMKGIRVNKELGHETYTLDINGHKRNTSLYFYYYHKVYTLNYAQYYDYQGTLSPRKTNILGHDRVRYIYHFPVIFNIKQIVNVLKFGKRCILFTNNIVFPSKNVLDDVRIYKYLSDDGVGEYDMGKFFEYIFNGDLKC